MSSVDNRQTEPVLLGPVVSAAAGYVVAFMAGTYWLARYGFSDLTAPLLRVVGLGLFIVAGVELVRAPARLRRSWTVNSAAE